MSPNSDIRKYFVPLWILQWWEYTQEAFSLLFCFESIWLQSFVSLHCFRQKKRKERGNRDETIYLFIWKQWYSIEPISCKFYFCCFNFFFQPKLAWDLSQVDCRDHRVFSSTRDLIAVIYYSHLSDSGFIICDSFTGTKSTRHSVEYINMLSPDRVSVTYCQH